MKMSVLSINRVFFLALGSVCFLVIPFFWLALVFDYKSLENFMFTLSQSYFVGYPVPELFGASNVDSPVSQVFRLKIFLSLALLVYALFFISLYSVEKNIKRMKFLFRGIAIPLFTVVICFWLKFLNEDHIIIKSEKTELFLATTISLVISIFLFSYSLRSTRKVISRRVPLKPKVENSETMIPSSVTGIQVDANEEKIKTPDVGLKPEESGEGDRLDLIPSVESQPVQDNELENNEENNPLDNKISQTSGEDVLPDASTEVSSVSEAGNQGIESDKSIPITPVEDTPPVAGTNTDPQETVDDNSIEKKLNESNPT